MGYGNTLEALVDVNEHISYQSMQGHSRQTGLIVDKSLTVKLIQNTCTRSRLCLNTVEQDKENTAT